MLEILDKCLKDSNLETVTKAELRKKYLEKTGLAKLPKEVKSQFTSAVNTAYLNYISAKINESTNDEIKENSEAEMLIMNSCSEDEITPANIKEDIIADKFANEVNDMQEEQSSDSDEKSLASYKNNGTKKLSNAIKKQRSKRTLSSSSEDEIIQIKSVQRNNVLKKARKSSDLETENRLKNTTVDSSDSDDEPLTVFRKKSKSFGGSLNSITKSEESENECHLKYVPKQSNNPIDSDNEPVKYLTKKKSNSFNDSKNHSSDYDYEPLTRFKKSNDPILLVEKTKFEANQKSIKYDFDLESKTNSSDSEVEPLAKYKKCNDYTHSDEDSNSFIKKKLNSSKKFCKLIDSTSGSEDEPVLTLTNKKSNSLNKFNVSRYASSESENESLAKYSKKKAIISDDSDKEPLKTLTKSSDFVNDSLKLMKNMNDSDDESLNMSNKKINNTNNCGKKPVTSSCSRSKENILKKKKAIDSDDDAVMSNQKKEYFDGQRNSLISDTSEDEPLSNMTNKESKSNLLNKSCISKNSSGSEIESPAKYSKKKVDNSLDSDEEPDVTSTKKSNLMNNSLKSMKYLSDSEDEPLINLNNKKTDNSSDSEKEPDEKIVKKKGENYLKKSITNRGKSKKQILKKKKSIDSDDDVSISSQKHEKSFDGLKNSLSDSSENEPLSKTKMCSDSEDEPLNRLSAEKSDKEQKSSESGSCSFADENEEFSNKKDKPSKKRDTNDSNKGRKRPSASENKIEHLKKYLRVAGIRIPNYNKLFVNCKTMKAKCEKLMSLLEKEGLKGRPTLEKCKKLRKKIETKREIAELDMSNILKMEGGRPKRSVCSDTTNCKPKEENSTSIKKFSRLQDIVDSEESD
ncbi:HIRA-interacting protein 3 like protein [Argiope bruennichi]|uniref:HIRA-interacting protein 3 like protein n=3 Tax=Argiope bruennichi TaxID=94029 RepID=A0A8T0E710_ARGBR|nr:HIRA-interacting protein 3 like protein [Argiope bruennichi]